MPEIPSVLPGEVIQSAWGNLIRDRTLQRYADQTELDISVPTPVAGEIAWLDDPGAVFVFDSLVWVRQSSSPKTSLVFSQSGLAKVTPDSGKYLTAVELVLTTVAATSKTNISGSTLIADVLLNGTSIFPTSAKPTIPDGGSTSPQAAPDTTVVPAGAVLTVAIDQIGAVGPGTDVSVIIGVV